MKTAKKLFLTTLLGICTAPSLSFAAVIVASGSTLDIEAGRKFDEATITISGPNGFNTAYTLSSDETQIDIDTLNIQAPGNYSYQIQYIQHGKVEYISDAKTGRQGAARNTGLIETSSGYFNVRDNEFVTEEVSEIELETSLQQVEAVQHSPLIEHKE
ncbi:hypothetical protein [Shewanella colwelliana]|uniref:hypothetical protein n=1 Tax=Shewanella colwelliana TaxID=23 RepID=UPI00299D95DB|nr:hypothetical protein [Shewanella colwelliana]MDX1281588.1 hypothetical protein [Shewanella colwelliana]